MLVAIYRTVTVLRHQSGSFPCRLTSILVPVRLLAFLVPHERRSSKSECGRNAARSDFTFPLYCLVLSCPVLFTSAPPLSCSGSSSSHALSPSPPFGLGPVRLCIVHHSHRALPCQLSSLPSLPFPLTCTVHLDNLGALYVLCRVILQAAGTVLLESYHKSTC